MAKQAQELTILEYFRTADLGKAELLFDLVRDVVKSRLVPVPDAVVVTGKPKKQRRRRRTKAEMEAARAAEAAAKSKPKKSTLKATDFQPDGEDVELRNAKVVATRIAEEIGDAS